MSQTSDLIEELRAYSNVSLYAREWAAKELLRKAADTIEELSKKEKEKHIGQTPYYEGDGYYGGKFVYDTWICPNCGEHYEVGYDNYKYCPECGQHIQHADWEK